MNPAGGTGQDFVRWWERWSDFFRRMPAVVILDRRPSPPEVAYAHKGSSTFDRPSIDDLPGELDELCSDATDAAGTDGPAAQ